MRILMLAPSLPHPPIWGFGIRVRQLLAGLSRRHQLTLLAYGALDETDKLKALSACASRVEAVTLRHSPARPRRSAQLAHLVSAHSYHLAQYRSREMQSAIDRLIAKGDFDAVQLESCAMSRFDFRDLPVFVDEHNIESELIERSIGAAPSRAQRLYKRTEYVKVRAEEAAAWRRASGCVVVSEREAAILHGRVPDTPVAVVPNGVDPGHFDPGSLEPDADTIVFTGLLTYAPNHDAVHFFVRSVFPLIRAVRPRARFLVVGWGARQLAHLAGDGVEFTGRVDDVRPLLGRAAVVVVPLRFGSGTRLKVLEAMAMARPIVSTTLGCEGIAVRDGEHLLVADEPDELAARVLMLLDSPKRGRQLGECARELAVRSYSWEASVEKLETFYRAALGDRGGRTAGAA